MRIFKYTLNGSISGIQPILIPAESKFLSVQKQKDNPTMWFLVNPEFEVVERRFQLFPTGHIDVPKDGYLGTVLLDDDTYVVHIFEV